MKCPVCRTDISFSEASENPAKLECPGCAAKLSFNWEQRVGKGLVASFIVLTLLTLVTDNTALTAIFVALLLYFDVRYTFKLDLRH